MKFKLRYFLESDFSDYQTLTSNPKIAQLAGMQILNNSFEQWMAFKGMLGRQGFLAIANENDQVVGGVFVFQQAEENLYEIGYLLEEGYWGQGIMSRAVYFAIKNLSKRNSEKFKVFANVRVDNAASQHVLEKNGFSQVDGVSTTVSGYDQTLQKEFRYELIVKPLE
jgi:ribosomal-protein-alanine N-acetyltransferase